MTNSVVPAIPAAAIVAAAVLFLAVVVFLTHRARMRQKEFKRLEREREESRRRLEKRLRRQKNLGDQMFNRLTEAARQNSVYNVMSDGKTAVGIGPIIVWNIEHNGNFGYSVMVEVKDERSLQGSDPIVEVDINAEQDRLHIFYGPYGPDVNRLLTAEFDRTTNELADCVRKWTLFPK